MKAKGDDFIGKDVWALAREEDEAGVFKLPKERKQLIVDGKASVFVEVVQHSNLRLRKETFDAKLANELLQYFGDQHGTVEFEIKIIERPDDDSESDLDL